MRVAAGQVLPGMRPVVVDRRGSKPGPPALRRVQDLLNTWVGQRVIAGAQVSVRLGDSAIDLCAGLARPGQDVTPGTLVPWFSAGKVVTSLVILRLAEERRLSLDEPVTAWIPEFWQPTHRQITLRHLLTHTSGLRDQGSFPFGRVDEVIRAAAEPVSRYSWEPGTHCAYSRYVEWYVLSAVIERVTGEPIQATLNDALRETGTERSAFGLTADAYDDLKDEIAYIYSAADKGAYQRLHAMRQEACRCDRVGNGLGPMRDLAAIMQALLPVRGKPGGLLREESKELARSCQARGTDQYFGVPLSYGLGVMTDVRWRFGGAWDMTSFGHVGSSVVGTLADPSVDLAAAFFVNGKIRSRSLNDSTPRFMAIGQLLAEDLGLRLPEGCPMVNELTRPASVGQRLLWMMDHYGSDTGALNVPVIYRLRGELDQGALRDGLADLAVRHESLRTTFAWAGRRLNQQISPSAQIPFRKVDATGMPEEALREEIRRTQREPLDVSKSAVCFTLFRRGDDDHILLLNIHHLVTDAWSNRLLSRDLAAFYTARRTGIPAQLPEVTWQFRRFQDWQDKQLNQQGMDGHFEFWETHLAGAQFPRLPRTERPASQRTSGIAEFEVTSETLAHLRHVARRHRTTLYTVMLCAFYCALFTLTGQRDLCLGSLFANRVRPEIRDTVGFFVNMLALRQDLAEGESVGDVLGRMRVTVALAVEHQEAPPTSCCQGRRRPARRLGPGCRLPHAGGTAAQRRRAPVGRPGGGVAPPAGPAHEPVRSRGGACARRRSPGGPGAVREQRLRCRPRSPPSRQLPDASRRR